VTAEFQGLRLMIVYRTFVLKDPQFAFYGMIWLLLLLSQVVCGFQIVFFVIRQHTDLFVQISIAIPLGFGLSSLTFFRLSTVLGMNIFHLFLHIFALSVLSV
jgi:hypothetical protein